MNKTPIIILTKDNPEYLYVTLKSLTATNLENNPVIIIDDCSDMPKTKTFLYTNDPLEVKFDDWTLKDDLNSQETADKEAAASYLNIPKISSILGIKKKFTIVRTKKYIGEQHRIMLGIKTAFDLYPNADKCIILEDDILFNKNWLKKMDEIYKYEFRSNVAMISSYSEIPKNGREYFKDEIIQGKAVLFTAKFYRKLRRLGLYSSMDLTGDGNAYHRLQRLAEKVGFICLTTNKSYIQNLEKRNLVNKDKVLMYDKNFVMPIAWNEEF